MTEFGRRAVGIGLVADAGPDLAGEAVRVGGLVDAGKILLDLARTSGGTFGAASAALEIAARRLERRQPVVENAELELEPRQAGREDQHALQRADRRLYVADLHRKRGIFERGVEIVRLLQHRLEQEFPPCLDLLGPDAPDLRRHHPLGRHGRTGLRKRMTGRNARHRKRGNANGVEHAPPERNSVYVTYSKA